MRSKKERSKQGQTNKQGKATQHTQGSMYMYNVGIMIPHIIYTHLKCSVAYVSIVDIEITITGSAKQTNITITTNKQQEMTPLQLTPLQLEEGVGRLTHAVISSLLSFEKRTEKAQKWSYVSGLMSRE